MTANANLATLPIGITGRCNVLLPGCRLDEYQIDTLLGSGGFGVTYKAWDTLLATWVAIKEYFPMAWSFRDNDGVTIYANTQGGVLSNNGASTSYYLWGLERFLDEARVLARIQHPCVVRVKRYFRAHGTAYIVMDYEDGKPLSTLLDDGETLSEEDVRGLLEDVLPALRAVHEQGFLHRDIKPSNLYIRDRDHRVMLIDFGAARQAVGHHTENITSLVTPGYSPPEQYTTRVDRQGAWTDLYALGAVLYRCVTGSPPIEAAERMLDDRLEPTVVAARAAYGVQLLQVIDQALAVRPEQRFVSVADMEAALNKADEPLQDDDATVILAPVKASYKASPGESPSSITPLILPQVDEPATDSDDLQVLAPINTQLEVISPRLDVLKLPAEKIAIPASTWRKTFLGGSLVLMLLIGVATTWWSLSGSNSQEASDVPVKQGPLVSLMPPAHPGSGTVDALATPTTLATAPVSSNTPAPAPVAEMVPVTASSANAHSSAVLEGTHLQTPEAAASAVIVLTLKPPSLPNTETQTQEPPQTTETAGSTPAVETTIETKTPSEILATEASPEQHIQSKSPLLPTSDGSSRLLIPEVAPVVKTPAKTGGKAASRRSFADHQPTTDGVAKPRAVRQQPNRKSPPSRQSSPIVSKASTSQKLTGKPAMSNPWESPASTGFNEK